MIKLLAALGLWWAAITGNTPSKPELGKAEVTLHIARDGARAVILLDHPTTRFQLERAPVARASAFRLLIAGQALQDDSITSATAFQRIEIALNPQTERRDAQYPAFYAIGDGGLVYAPALRGDPAVWKTRMTVEAAPGQVCVPACGGLGESYVFSGPKALVQVTSAMVVVTDPAMPAWLAEQSRNDLSTAVQGFTQALRVPLPAKPILILKYIADGRGEYVGDVTPGYMTALRFYGSVWSNPGAGNTKNVQAFIRHEAFHFWNAGVALQARGTPMWLHEGGAEYASLLSRYQSGDASDDEVRDALSNALTGCRNGLQSEGGDKGLADLPSLSDKIRYPCGIVIQWAADLHVRRVSGGKRTVLDTWESVIRTARTRTDRSYGVDDFYKAADAAEPDERVPAVLLVDRQGAERWQTLTVALNALGADITHTATPETRRKALLFHLLGQNCSAPPGQQRRFGFSFPRGAIQLDSPVECGALASSPIIKTVEGGDPYAMSAETYAAVQQKCASGSNITLVTGDDRTLSAACSAPLAPAPEGYLVRRWGSEPWEAAVR